MQPRFYMVLYMISTPGYWIIGALPWVALPLTQQKKFHRYIKLKVSRVYYQSFIPFWTITLGTFPRTSPVPNLSSSGENLLESCSQKLPESIRGSRIWRLEDWHASAISQLFFFCTKKNTLRLFQHTELEHTPSNLLPTGYKGCPFIVGEGDCLGCALGVCWNFLGNTGGNEWINK